MGLGMEIGKILTISHIYRTWQKDGIMMKTVFVFIIFVTAKSDSDDETEGLSVGAVDYITKPVKADITLARIRTQLELSRAQKQLVNYNQQIYFKT